MIQLETQITGMKHYTQGEKESKARNKYYNYDEALSKAHQDPVLILFNGWVKGIP